MSASRGAFADLPAEEPYPGVRRRSFDAAGATVTEYAMAPGARFPLHHHPQEQITVVEEGEVELTIAGETSRLGAGEWSVVGPGVEHGITNGDRPARFLAILVPRRPPGGYTIVGR